MKIVKYISEKMTAIFPENRIVAKDNQIEKV